MIIVSDTTSISNLFLIDHLWIIEKLYKTIIIPDAVYQELLRFNEFAPDISAITSASWIKRVDIENNLLVETLRKNLDQGEAEAIALAHELGAELLIMDELKGRDYAQKMNINIIGLVGILIHAKQRGIIPNVAEILRELREKAGFWLNDALYQKVLSIANEQDFL